MQKAKLDILENIPDIDAAGAQEGIDGVSHIAGRQWANNKLIALASALVLVLLVIAGGVWFYLTKSSSLKDKEEMVSTDGDGSVKGNKVIGEATVINNIDPSALPRPDKVTTIYFKDFFIDLKDSDGKSKLLVCDVAIDIIENQDDTRLANSIDVRKTIYLAAKGKSAVALKSSEERKRLEKEITAKLARILGEGVIKNLYFTNYLIV